jgi:hypothetical protein
MAQAIVKVFLNNFGDFEDVFNALDADEIRKLQIKAINEVIGDAYQLSFQQMSRGINLSDQYIYNRMQLNLAGDKPVASIISSGQRTYLTALSHYKPEQLIQPNKQKRKAKGRTGIQAGYKSAGVSIETVIGGRRRINSDRVFLDYTRKDSEGNPFLFKRVGGSTKTGKSRLERLMGPSVYILLAHALPVVEPKVSDNLVQTISDSFDKVLSK